MASEEELAAVHVNLDKLPTDIGSDTNGGSYSSIADLWVNELGDGKSDDKNVTWYPKAIDYWKGVPATIDGMMGGLTEISKKDLRTSHDFLKYFLDGKCQGRKPTSNTRALDCGAGIGRVTSNLLLPLFETVDLVEQNNAFVEEAKNLIKSSKMGHFYCSGLQDFVFNETYDVIWIQWVIGHLHDDDLIRFLMKCKQALTPNGLLCIKDNVSSLILKAMNLLDGKETCDTGFVFDKQDSSVTRSDKHMRALFTQADMTVVRVLLQPNFPKKLFPVRIYALC